jgi:hypothetical protein
MIKVSGTILGGIPVRENYQLYSDMVKLRDNHPPGRQKKPAAEDLVTVFHIFRKSVDRIRTY